MKDIRLLPIQGCRIPPLYRKKKDAWLVRETVLEEDGVRFSGIILGKQDRIRNGKWIVQSVPIGSTIESFLRLFNLLELYEETDYNILMVNNPNVGRSQGTSSPTTIPKVQNLALEYLEKVVNAKKIIVAGISFGAICAISSAGLHHFKEDVHYRYISMMPFDKMSDVSARYLGLPFIAPTCRAIGMEMDFLKACKILEQKKVSHVILQKTSAPKTEPPQENSSSEAFVDDAEIKK